MVLRVCTTRGCGRIIGPKQLRQLGDIGRDPPRIVASHPPDKREAVSAILLVGFVRGRDDTASERRFM